MLSILHSTSPFDYFNNYYYCRIVLPYNNNQANNYSVLVNHLPNWFNVSVVKIILEYNEYV